MLNEKIEYALDLARRSHCVGASIGCIGLLAPPPPQQIDARRVEFKPDEPGEIIIAYKGKKTPEAEQAALVKAITTLAGADTTTDSVATARKADFDERVSLWDACVPDGKCQKEASNDHQ